MLGLNFDEATFGEAIANLDWGLVLCATRRMSKKIQLKGAFISIIEIFSCLKIVCLLSVMIYVGISLGDERQEDQVEQPQSTLNLILNLTINYWSHQETIIFLKIPHFELECNKVDRSCIVSN